MSHPSLPPRQTGFTMIEVLVAVLVLAVGLLGLAGLQTMGLRATTGSYVRTQAITVAQELAERMRLNNINHDTVTAYPYDDRNVTACTDLAAPASTSPDDIATFDLDQAFCNAQSNFNLQSISITCADPPCAPATPSTFGGGGGTLTRTLTINWQEVGLTGQLEAKNIQVQMIP